MATRNKDDVEAEEQEVGIIALDAIYTPVVRVRYNTEQTRVGQKINYDRLIMEIWTDGTIDPEMALVESAKILRKHLGPFVQYFEMTEDLTDLVAEETNSPEDTVDAELQQKLATPVGELGLSVRANNCLEQENIETIGQLLHLEESKLLSFRSFGKTTLREVKRKLADMGLLLGMNIDDEE